MFDLFSFNNRSAAYVEMQRLNEADSLPTGNTSLFYRAICPTDPAQNVIYRQRIMDLAYDHKKAEQYRHLFWTIASRDILWWVNTFVYTHSPKDYADAPIRPFVTWEQYQNRDILKLQAAIGNYDLTITKSRDMGATNICLLPIRHRWQFKANQRFLLASEKEDLVEKKGDMRALFEKIDFIDRYMPRWMLPTGRELGDDDPHRTNKHLGNADNGSTIEGEATVKNLGQGDRLTAVLIDEYASIPFTAAIERATRDATACRIRNSTPKPRNAEGAGFFKYFDKEFKRDPSDNNTRLIVEHWTQHPLKAAGLYKLDHNGIKIPLDPTTYDWRSDFPFTTRTEPRSPWYDEQCNRANSKTEIDQELNLDFYGLGRRAFDSHLLSRLLTKTQPPAASFQVHLDHNNQLLILPNTEGNFHVWCPFTDNKPPASDYIFGEDIAGGLGGDFSSNSALCILDANLRQVVATFTDNTIDPARFACLCNELGKLFNNPFHCPEVNGGGGGTFMAALIPLTTNIIRRDMYSEDPRNKKTKRYGIWNNDRGTIILSQLQMDLIANQFTIHSEQIVKELSEYEMADDAKVRHGGSSDPDSAAHGDLAIATAGAALGLRERAAKRQFTTTPVMPEVYDSFVINNFGTQNALYNDCPQYRADHKSKINASDRWEP